MQRELRIHFHPILYFHQIIDLLFFLASLFCLLISSHCFLFLLLEINIFFSLNLLYSRIELASLINLTKVTISHFQQFEYVIADPSQTLFLIISFTLPASCFFILQIIVLPLIFDWGKQLFHKLLQIHLLVKSLALEELRRQHFYLPVH